MNVLFFSSFHSRVAAPYTFTANCRRCSILLSVLALPAYFSMTDKYRGLLPPPMRLCCTRRQWRHYRGRGRGADRPGWHPSWVTPDTRVKSIKS